MEESTMKDMTLSEQTNNLQRMFLAPSAFAEVLRANACGFWGNQTKILDSMENFATSWFERRHIGTQEAMQAAQRMCEAESPVEAMRCYQEWANGAVGRIAADGLAWQQFMTALGALTQPNIPSLSEKDTDPSQSQIKTSIRSKAA
jgi:hypothetical protein